MANQITIKESLAKVGIIIDDVYDLVNTSEAYPEAIPVLLELLKEGVEDDTTKEGVIRALAVKEAKGKAKVLIEEYNKTPIEKKFLRWAIGNTIEVIFTEQDVEDIIPIVLKKDNETSRQMFVLALGKAKSEQAEQTLISLLDDDDVVLHALSALGRMKSIKAKGKIEKLLVNASSVVKKKAEKILKKINKNIEST